MYNKSGANGAKRAKHPVKYGSTFVKVVVYGNTQHTEVKATLNIFTCSSMSDAFSLPPLDRTGKNKSCTQRCDTVTEGVSAICCIFCLRKGSLFGVICCCPQHVLCCHAAPWRPKAALVHSHHRKHLLTDVGGFEERWQFQGTVNYVSVFAFINVSI